MWGNDVESLAGLRIMRLGSITVGLLYDLVRPRLPVGVSAACACTLRSGESSMAMPQTI